ncbi:MAG: TetR/AcrR family transcriptional regulator [Proteobacteria bacterium]|nr:TetR/AcrR family transcriptional regulator [Pseudomonadota bacterium]
MGKRQIAAQETRQKLVDAAKKLILEVGFDNFSVSDITEKAGVAKGSFYTYFGHKEDIIDEVTHQNLYPLRDKSLSIDGCVVAKLSHYLTEAMSQIVEYGLVSAQNWLRLGMEPGNVCVLNKMQLDMSVIEEILLSGINSGELSGDIPVMSVRHCIMAEFYGIVVTWCISNGAINAMDLIQYYCNQHLNKLFSEYQKTEAKQQRRA